MGLPTCDWNLIQPPAVHAHIVMWIDEDDVETVDKNITAAVPGVFVPNEGNGSWQPPVNATEQDKDLLSLVLAHQQHVCWPNLCCKTGKCRSGFPYPSQNSTSPVLDESRGSYCYYRPGHEHRNIVPYHPGILLVWKAHMNIQKVTAQHWTYYMLKYATKANFITDVTPCKTVANKLGLTDVSDSMLHLLSV